MAYFWRQHSSAAINYESYYKEPLAIISAFKKCCPLSEVSPHTGKVISDYRNMTNFTTNGLLNHCQTNWVKFLKCFDFQINYWLRKANGTADVLTCQGRWSEDQPHLQEAYHIQILLKSYNLALLVAISSPDGGPTFYDLLQTTYEAELFTSEVC
jgi:hypothetical protein